MITDLDESISLAGQSIKNLSSDQLQQLIAEEGAKKQAETEAETAEDQNEEVSQEEDSSDEEQQEESSGEDTEEQEQTEEQTEDDEEEDQQQDRVNYEDLYKAEQDRNAAMQAQMKAVLDKLNSISTVSQKIPTQEEKKELTHEELLKALATNPKGFVTDEVNSIIQPIADDLKRLRKDQVLQSARRNTDFSRLEPVIDKLAKADFNKEDIRLEILFRCARDMEREELSKKETQKKAKEEKKRTALKKKASTFPKQTKRVVTKVKTKSEDEMTSEEFARSKGLKVPTSHYSV